MKSYAIILGLVVVTVFADYWLKIASERSDWATSRPFALGAALYAVSAAGWVLAMQRMSLAGIGVAYSVATVVLLTTLGVVVFRETLTGREVLGIGCALVALVLMGQRH